MARNTRTFSDLDLNFTAHPLTGDIARKYDDEAIKQSVRNLILTNNYERPFHSEIGSQIRGLLFEPVTPMLNMLLKRAIIDTITNFEPRVRLIDVLVRFSPDNNDVYISIQYMIVNTTRPIQIDLVLKRTR
jgi:phage baseplate assembly protein W